MASGSVVEVKDERAGAEMVYGAEACAKQSKELLEELGFPTGVMPLKELVECGRVRETGFVWMKQKAPSQHYFEGTKSLVSYAIEVTCYVDKGRMKKMKGVKSKQLMMWISITEMSVDQPCSGKIHFSTGLGITKSFPVSAFLTSDADSKSLDPDN
ncbi:hypothetical protein RND81_03G128800 [Saponaria officinalis]|uniref:Uncharacterized protein n=1 Tax=Saponaria officinalis TaxID=3572 RepID=A0AAW1M7B5_SAPOF